MPGSRLRLATNAQLPTSGAAQGRRVPSSKSGNFPIVAIGASAGGLDACRKLLDAVPDGCGMAFVLVQHLDPNHESMMVELLASHTAMTVLQAADGMIIEPDHLYVIPPGAYLSVSHSALNVVPPNARHGARLPFDFLLHTLAEDCGTRAVCVILSGTGTDGSLGLKSIKDRAGLVIAQLPEEAGYDGMPRNAIATGRVDHVLSVARIPAMLASYRAELASFTVPRAAATSDGADVSLLKIIDLLREKTAHDFSL